MPMPLINDDVVELTMVGNYQGSYILNVFHYMYQGVGFPFTGDAELNNLMSQFETNIWDAAGGSIRARLVTDYTLLTLKAQIVHPARRYYVNQVVANPNGSGAPPGIPSDTNITVSLRTARAVRGTTGNKKFTGLPINDLSGANFGIVSIFNWSVVSALWFQIFTDTGAVPSWYPIVWSKKRAADRAQPIGSLVRPEVRVLRRREKGIGI